MQKTFTITSDHVGSRLDIFLQQNLSDISRSQIQKMIKDGVITVNDKKIAPHHFLKIGDVIVIPASSGIPPSSVIPNASSVIPALSGGGKPLSLPLNAQTLQGYAPALSITQSEPAIISQTPDYLILDKPTGLTVHPSDTSSRAKRGIPMIHTLTLVDWLLSHHPAIHKVGDDPLRPGIVHRLDKDASGIMVVALTHESFESLIRQFKLRQVKKEYLVLVAGRVTPIEGVIDLPIGRSKKDYTRRAAHSKEGRPAVTRYEVLEQFKHAALVRVTPETGRTHQIRVHFFAKGNPVIGDPIYVMSPRRRPGPSLKKRPEGTPLQLSRLMLHAEHLGFRDLSGEWQDYRVPPPAEFEKIVQEARTA